MIDYHSDEISYSNEESISRFTKTFIIFNMQTIMNLANYSDKNSNSEATDDADEVEYATTI